MSEPANAAHAHALQLTEHERERKWPNLRPRDAATLIVLDSSGKYPKVLMGRRNPALKFMPGKFVFPGGGIEPGDRRMNIAGSLPLQVEDKLIARVSGGSSARARALALAAIRETFEETGLLIGAKDMGTPENPPAGHWSTFASHGVFPNLENLHFIARAITPPRRPRRFDARFFAVNSSEIAHKVEGITGPESELVELVWQRLDKADKLDLPSITSVVLKELADRLAAGFGHYLPVPFLYEKNRRWFREAL